MATAREPIVVAVVVVLSFTAVVAGLVAFPSQSPSLASLCTGPASAATPPSQLTPENPVLLPRCAQYSLSSGFIVFSVHAAIDLRGSWVATTPVSLAVFNTTATGPNYGWPCPGCYGLEGTLNLTLFPGTYQIEFAVPFDSGAPVLTATQAIVADFDRGLDVLQTSGVSWLPANGYSAWTFSAPAGASSFFLEGSVATTGCSFELAVLPPAVYQAFETDRNAIDWQNVTLIQSGYASSCPNPPVSTNVGFGELGPFNLTSGDTLVFFNSWGSTVQFSVLGPIEVSYLTANLDYSATNTNST